MGNFGASRLAFYVGVLCMILGALSIPMGWNLWGASPGKFVQSADTWFLIAAVILLHSIDKKLTK